MHSEGVVTCEIREHVGKLGITSKDGVPLGAVIMVVYYVVLFVLKL
ncbi:MAG: hypothetical protein Q7J35_05215 [Candidatus Methanoperedens sp.]|nr:hypothetical protein [Candidatus Methanoperedens sp.]